MEKNNNKVSLIDQTAWFTWLSQRQLSYGASHIEHAVFEQKRNDRFCATENFPGAPENLRNSRNCQLKFIACVCRISNICVKITNFDCFHVRTSSYNDN